MEAVGCVDARLLALDEHLWVKRSPRDQLDGVPASAQGLDGSLSMLGNAPLVRRHGTYVGNAHRGEATGDRRPRLQIMLL